MLASGSGSAVGAEAAKRGRNVIARVRNFILFCFVMIDVFSIIGNSIIRNNGVLIFQKFVYLVLLHPAPSCFRRLLLFIVNSVVYPRLHSRIQFSAYRGFYYLKE